MSGESRQLIVHEDALKNLQETLKRFTGQLDVIEVTGRRIIKSLKAGGKILSCGNGGSAADALHLAEEFVGRYRGERKSLPAICLAADVTALTCIGNDYGFDEVFARQIEGLGKKGDVLAAFTTSGNSPNVVRAIKVARDAGLETVLLAGKTGGLAKGLADFELIIPSDDSARIQEVHTFILHQWLEMVEAESW